MGSDGTGQIFMRVDVDELAVVLEPAAARSGRARRRCVSSRRTPRRSHGWPIATKSSGHGLMPTPSRSRLPVSTATLAACLASSTAGRTGALSTNVVNRMRSVTAASHGIRANGSMIGLSSRNSRSPSAVYG